MDRNLTLVLLGTWLIWAAWLACAEALRQFRAYGRVPLWDWVAFELILGPVRIANEGVNAGLWHVRAHWQTRTAPPAPPGDYDHLRPICDDARAALERAFVVVLAIVLLAIGAGAAFLWGFGWALLVCAFVGWLIAQGDLGQHGEGAYAVVAGWILLAVGIAIGLVIRLVLP